LKKITIRKYGARLLGDSEPIIVKSMRDQNTLWNKLVEIERANTTEYRDIVAQSDDVLAALTQEYAAAEQRLKDVQEMRNRVRAAKRSKQIEGAENYAAEIKAISSSLKDLRARMKECRARAKEAAKPRLEGLEDRRRAAVKQATNEAAIWWAHSELVTNSFDVARVKALKSNAELRFHRFEGEGRIGVRIQNGILLGNQKGTIANKDGTKQHITLPPELLARFERSTRLRSELDVAANEFWVRTASLFTDDILATLSEDEWLRVLVGKAKRAHRPYPCGSGLKFLEGFWDSYLKVGRCAIDPSHTEHFRASRFREHESGRICLWCGHHQRKVIKPRVVQETTWVST
jgi:hypothetical protein